MSTVTRRSSPPAPIGKRLGSVNTYSRRSFTAKYDGVCGTCPAPIAVGDAVFYPTAGSENVSGLDCCGDRTDDELIPRRRDDSALAVDDEDDVAAIARVLPRNARSACGRCYQIPASNGACGCNY